MNFVPIAVANDKTPKTNISTNAVVQTGLSFSRKKYGEMIFPIWPRILTIAPAAAPFSGVAESDEMAQE
jgi:hypothetical protein